MAGAPTSMAANAAVAFMIFRTCFIPVSGVPALPDTILFIAAIVRVIAREFKQRTTSQDMTFAWGCRQLDAAEGCGLFALPVRRALVEKGVHSLAEVLAHVGAKDQIFALVARQRPPDAAHRLFCHLERNRRMARNQFRGF